MRGKLSFSNHHFGGKTRIAGKFLPREGSPLRLPWDDAPHCLIRDRDRVYGVPVKRRLRAMGIRDKPIARGSPWQNGFAERLIGLIRRECVDHVIVVGEAHLRRLLAEYAAYYNELRTHRSLNKDAPVILPHRAKPLARIFGTTGHGLPPSRRKSLQNQSRVDNTDAFRKGEYDGQT